MTAKENRLFLEAVLWRVRTGLPWRHLPQGFGKWKSVFQRFRCWVRARNFDRIFARVSDQPDFECALIDDTIFSAHQKGERRKDPMGHRTAERWLGPGSDHLDQEALHGRHPCHGAAC